MAVYKIVAFGAGVPPFTLPSTVTTGNFAHAFLDFTKNNTLTVDVGAYLIAKGTGAAGAFINDAAGWTINVNGSIVSQQAEGIVLNASVGGASKVNVGAEGQISGAHAGIGAFSPTTITNKGLIYGTAGPGIGLGNTGLHTINNAGTITGQVAAIQDITGTGTDKVTNAGTINGHIELGGGDDTVMNTKTINGVVNMGTGNNSVTNSGSLTVKDLAGLSLIGGSGNDTVSNAGTIAGDVNLGTGNNLLTNTGTINGRALFSFSGGDDTLINKGTIKGDVELADGVLNKLTNSGTIEGDVYCSSTSALITNSGTISKSLFLFAGDDEVVNTGKILGSIKLGDGSDKYTGGNFADTIGDSNGSETIKLSGGNDSYIAAGSTGTDGADTIDGGAGIDTYDASSGTDLSGMVINLDKIAHGSAAANAATGVDIGTDQIFGFENAIGGDEGATIHGTAGNNYLQGGVGLDALYGYAGNDTLVGGFESDLLEGGAGKDYMHGGGGGDTFKYLSIKDSGVTAATRDVIHDFAGGGAQRINLSMIDANTTNGTGDDQFNFIGTNKVFTGVPGQLRAYWTATGQIIEGDVNGDRKADFSIEIVDPTHAVNLSGVNNVDFVL